MGVKVGLEIHQQLATNKKLFCSCKPAENEEYDINNNSESKHKYNYDQIFHRKLRIAKSELGEYDPAALFERSRSRSITYYANDQTSCLVEYDEEPPHELDHTAKDITLIIAATLHSKIFDEIYPMRKTVVDGSNTTGFQRTMLISQGGYYTINDTKIGIQSICLEEDAAKNLGDKKDIRRFGLGRLGIPLVEIATEPFDVDLDTIKDIARGLGRILRSTNMVRRGLGSIRQDVNVSIREGRVVIEVKGVQQLDQLRRVIEYEAKRQDGLLQISNRLKQIEWIEPTHIDITDTLVNCKSKIIQKAIRDNQRIVCIPFKNMSTLFGFEPYSNVRLGRDVAELVRVFGIGGVFHSDELPNYGITDSDIDDIKNVLQIQDSAAFLILAVPKLKIQLIVQEIIRRIKHIREYGIPADTRMATLDGETKFLRPRPGAARMYPETDIPPIIVSDEERAVASRSIPKSWDESIKEIQEKHGINLQLASQIFDSRYIELFDTITQKTKVNPTFVASILCSSITNLEREGLDSSLLKDTEIVKTFEFLDRNIIAKESIDIIFQNIMSGKSDNIEKAIKNTAIETIPENEIEQIIVDIVDGNNQLIQDLKEHAIGPLMGIVMKQLRGKADGQTINKILKERISDKLSTQE